MQPLSCSNDGAFPWKSLHLWGHWGFCACRVCFLQVGSKTHPSGRQLRVCSVPWEPTAQSQVSYLLEKQKPPPRAWKWVLGDNSSVILGWRQRLTSPFPFSTVDEYSPQRKVRQPLLPEMGWFGSEARDLAYSLHTLSYVSLPGRVQAQGQPCALGLLSGFCFWFLVGHFEITEFPQCPQSDANPNVKHWRRRKNSRQESWQQE